MVYCVNCGANNPDGALNCVQCGRSIMRVEQDNKWRGEKVTFGMPHHLGGVLVGLFLIIIGLVFLFGEFVPMLAKIFWPLILIFVGATIILSGLYRSSRR